MNRPDYYPHSPITGEWHGEQYLLTRPAPLHNLTWPFLWSLIRLKLASPRRDKFKVMIADYGYDN